MSDSPWRDPYPWQQPLWQRLQEQLQAGRLPHALLLAGAEANGLEAFAQAFAQRMLCAKPVAGLACGRCRGCELNRAGSHPDLLTLRPEAPGKAIKVEQVRDLTDFLGKTAQQGGRKIVLLHPAEAMNANAANALLKNLEEPAGDSLLLLISHQPSRLLATVRSRCQRWDFPLPAAGDCLPWLAEVSGEPETRLRDLLALVGGRPLAVLDALHEDAREQRQQRLAELAALAQQQTTPVAVAGQWQGAEPVPLLDALYQWLAALIASPLRDQPLPDELRELADALPPALRQGPQPLLRYLDRLSQAKARVQSGANPNVPLLWETLLLDWQRLCARRH